ncbi:hypothetical protein O181_020909 [Austropuccinia psidii MF-1]|uniref:Peroxisomal biogenesis factor 11 n=1 Tax=Austropuccinia psidii MF-1 TaxID=1389203 RepID=A0A9Q3GW55_9BASI|nr:hypothetical protein [Austropuccinia psidii MF-1]
MTSFADQIILHPVVSASLKVGNTTVGRDKLYRTAQYFSRFLVWYLQKYDHDKQMALRFNNLKSALGLSRKLMRIGKPLEHLQAALKATKEFYDPVLAICTIGRQLAYASYLFNDMVIWAEKIKFITVEKANLANVNKRAAQFWMVGILLNIASGVYKHQQVQTKLRQCRKNYSKTMVEHEKEEKKLQTKSLSTQAFAVRLQLLQDLCDLISPSSTLGYHSLNDGVIGIAGVISSLLGLRTQVNKVLGGAGK